MFVGIRNVVWILCICIILVFLDDVGVSEDVVSGSCVYGCEIVLDIYYFYFFWVVV